MCPGEDGVCGWAGSVALPGPFCVRLTALLKFNDPGNPGAGSASQCHSVLGH